MGGLTRLPLEGKDIVLFSNLDTNASHRERVTVWVSFDGARTWPLKRLVDPGRSGYSSLAVGRPGTPSEGWIYLHYEHDPLKGSHIACFNLAWLLDGERTNFPDSEYRNSRMMLPRRIVLLAAILGCALGLLPVATADPELVPVGLEKQLFADDFVIAELENVTREVGRVEKHGVVLEPTLPTDFQAGKVHDGPDGGPGYEFGESAFCWFFSPHWDEAQGGFRLWYMASKRPGSGLAYAESTDGIHWTKPLISKDGRSNLVQWDAPIPKGRGPERRDLLEMGLDGVTVMIDPTLPAGAKEKYKVAFFPNGGAAMTRLGYSSDGIHWSFYNEGHPVTGRAADFSNQVFWDPRKGRYLLLCRQDFAAGGGVGELRGVRIMEHSEGNDLLNHPTAWKTLATFVLDDPDEGVIRGTNIPQRQIHTFPLWYYEGIYFALVDVLVATNRPVPAGGQDFHTRHEQGVWEFYMAPSRDAVHFDFAAAAYARKPLIPRGPDGSFDKDCVRPPSSIITKDDEHWIYYLATNERWGARKWDARLGLAKLRLDGFFCLEARERSGTVVTKPFVLEGNRLELNVDATEGFIKAELLDEAGEPIAGFSGGAAKTFRGYDDVRLRAEWNRSPDLLSLEGERVRLRFTLGNARLYAFQIKTERGPRAVGASELSPQAPQSAGASAGEPIFAVRDEEIPVMAHLAVAMDGTVLLFKEERERGRVEVRRSEDGGVTWSDPIVVGKRVKLDADMSDDGRYRGDHVGWSELGSVTVHETTGDILVFAGSLMPASIVYRSRDHGETWQTERITIKPDANGWLATSYCCDPGLTLRYGAKKGRLVMPTQVFVGPVHADGTRTYLNKGLGRRFFAKRYSNALYSDDGGRTWTPSAPFPVLGTSEPSLVELHDGRIYYNARTHCRPGNKIVGESRDGGETWVRAREDDELFDGPPDDYGCKAALVRVPYDDRDVLLFSSPGRRDRRDDITVHVSFDGGETWPRERLVKKGPGNYTWMAAGRDGTPSEGMIYLVSNKDWMARFNLAWLLEQPSSAGQ